MKIKAAVARGRDRPLVIEGLDLDEPRAGEIVVRMVACGLSRRDLQAIGGDLAVPLPFVPGAEGAGIVEHLGDGVSGVDVGDAVILTAARCGTCPRCVDGDTRECEAFATLNLSGLRLDGSAPFSSSGRPIGGFFMGQSALATHLVCPAACAVRLPVGAALEVLAPLGGQMLEVACAICTFDLGPHDTFVVTGAGPAGLLAVMLAKDRGVSLIVVADPDEARHALATELGATIATHAAEDLATVVRSLAADGARYALETTGDALARRACLDSLCPGGLCAVVGASAGAILGSGAQVTEDGDRLIDAANGLDAAELVPQLAALHASGRLPLETLIDFYPFEQVNDGLEALREGRVLKPVVRFPIGSFGDLDRALTEGAASEEGQDTPAPEEAPARDEQDTAPVPVA